MLPRMNESGMNDVLPGMNESWVGWIYLLNEGHSAQGLLLAMLLAPLFLICWPGVNSLGVAPIESMPACPPLPSPDDWLRI